VNEEDKKLKIATFRFGLISEFITGTRLSYGEREKLLKEKINRSYEVPFSTSKSISRTTLEKWILDYKKAGYRL